MTKLYHEEGAWTVPGKQGRKAERHDVPNSPDELAHWLNARRVSAEPTAEIDGDGHYRPKQQLVDNAEPIADPEGPASEPHPGLSEHAEARRMAMGRCPRCNGTPRGAHLLLKGEEKDCIVEFIEQADELWMIEAIALAVRDRVKALGLAIEEQGGVQ